MKKLVIVLLLFQIAQFGYFSYEIDQVKSSVTNNAATANERAKASVIVALQTQDQLNSLKETVTTILSHMK